MEYISCDLCGQDNYQTILLNCATLGGPLVRCNNCGLIYVNPRSTDFSVNESTRDASVKRQDVWKQYSQIWDTSLVSADQEIKHLHDNFRFRIQRIKEFITTGSILDIGCGPGHFLSVAKESGFTVMGIEPNEKTARLANQNYGLDVITGVLPKNRFKQGSFDAVTMLHVLEHLPSPSRELFKINDILRTGGFLFIEVPQIDTIWFRLLKCRWRQLIPDHYFFFTPQTIKLLLEQEGFQVVDISMIGKHMSLRFFLSRLWRYHQGLTSSLVKLVESTRLADRGIYVNLGDIMFVVARKIETL